MLDLAAATAEIPPLIDALVRDGLAAPGPAALVGISMGGYLAYRAPLVAPQLRTVVSILGSPEWPGPDSPHRTREAFHRVALLSITAERDESVPPDAARRFHAALAAGHPTPERAMDATIDWLRRPWPND